MAIFTCYVSSPEGKTHQKHMQCIKHLHHNVTTFPGMPIVSSHDDCICVIVCDRVWSCVIVCDRVWSCVIVCDRVWSCVIVCTCTACNPGMIFSWTGHSCVMACHGMATLEFHTSLFEMFQMVAGDVEIASHLALTAPFRSVIFWTKRASVLPDWWMDMNSKTWTQNAALDVITMCNLFCLAMLAMANAFN